MGTLQASGQALQGIKTHWPLCRHVSSRGKCCYERWCMQTRWMLQPCNMSKMVVCGLTYESTSQADQGAQPLTCRSSSHIKL